MRRDNLYRSRQRKGVLDSRNHVSGIGTVTCREIIAPNYYINPDPALLDTFRPVLPSPARFSSFAIELKDIV